MLFAHASPSGVPLAALPNIGLASLSGGRVIYPHAAPEYFAEFAAHARNLGARVIGGCCGTTPTEIAAIRAAVEEAREPRSRLEFSERELVEALGEEQRETAFARADPEAARSLGAFREGLKLRKDAAQREIDLALVEERGARDALAEAFETLKKYEHVAETNRVAVARETARRENAVLDEMGLRRAAGRR